MVHRCANIYIDIDTRIRYFATIDIKRDGINGESQGITSRRSPMETSFTEISSESAGRETQVSTHSHVDFSENAIDIKSLSKSNGHVPLSNLPN